MTNPRTLITADWVLGHENGHHVLLPNAQVVYEGGAILHVGHGYDGEVAERIDAGAALVAPGFIDLDALSDLDTTILSFDNHPAWRKGRVWPQSYVDAGPYEMYSPEELSFQKRYAFARLIRNGITTALPIASLFYRQWGETVEEFAAAAQAASDLGLRVYLGPAYRTGNPVVVAENEFALMFDEPRGLTGLADAIAFCQRFEGHKWRAGARHAGPGPDRDLHRNALLRRNGGRWPRSGRAGAAALLPGRIRGGDRTPPARQDAGGMAGRAGFHDRTGRCCRTAPLSARRVFPPGQGAIWT